MTAIRHVSRRVAAGAAVLLAVGLAGGCGGLLGLGSDEEAGTGEDAAAEGQDAPEGVEQDAADVEVDAGDVNVSVDTDEQTITLGDGDGEVSITTGAEDLPEWFPPEMPVPEEFAVLSVTEVQGEDGVLLGTMVTTTADFEDVIAVLDEGLAAVGIEITDRTVSEIAGMHSGMYFLVLDGAEWSVIVGDLGEEAETSLMYATGE